MEQLRQQVFTRPETKHNNFLDKCDKFRYEVNTGLLRPIKIQKDDDDGKKVYGINSRSDIMNASRPSTEYFHPKS